MELRAVIAEIRSPDEGEERRVSGLGIVYDQWTELFPGFRERINKGAAKPDGVVKSYYNHNPSLVLSTIESDPPLELRETDQGVEFSSPIPPTSYGRDLEVNLERRNVKGASFAFSVPRGGDRIWEDEDGVMHREIKELHYYEVGPVTDPAYVQTTATASQSPGEVLQEARRRVQANRDEQDQRSIDELALRKMQAEIKSKEVI